MALDDTDRLSDELDRVLRDEIDGYGPPSVEELADWFESAPHPSEAADYESVGSELDG